MVGKIFNYNNNLEIKSVDIVNDKEAVEFTEKLEVEIGSYASLNQGEYIFSQNVTDGGHRKNSKATGSHGDSAHWGQGCSQA